VIIIIQLDYYQLWHSLAKGLYTMAPVSASGFLPAKKSKNTLET
jgi:hypothetical protein